MQNPLIETALKITEKRRRILSDMREAVTVGDRDKVFELAKKLTGLSDEQERCPID
jgi:hypothetical protein